MTSDDTVLFVETAVGGEGYWNSGHAFHPLNSEEVWI